MQEAEQQIYLNLVQELLNCTPGQEIDLLKTKPEMVNEKLVDTLLVAAQMFDRQENQESKSTAKWLVDFTQYLARQIGLDLRSEEEKRPSTSDYDEQIQFLIEVLQSTSANNGNSKVVYPLLRQKLALLNEQIIDVFKTWIKARLSEFERDGKESLARTIYLFSELLREFPLGSKVVNMELAIVCKEIALDEITFARQPKFRAEILHTLAIIYRDRLGGNRVDNLEKSIIYYASALCFYTKENAPVVWAGIQHKLAFVYRKRIGGDRSDNLEKSINCYLLALEVRTRKDLAMGWAGTQQNLAIAYYERIKGDKAENLEKSINCSILALEILSKKNLSFEWAKTQIDLATAYIERIKGDKAENLEKSIEHSTLALEIATRECLPMGWVRIQNNLAAAYLWRIKGDRKANLEESVNYYTSALEILTKEISPMGWAVNQYYLAFSYGERLAGHRADNLEKSITCSISALEVLTKENSPIEWAMAQSHLATKYFNRIRGDRSDNLEKSISCYISALQIHTKEDSPVDWVRNQNNIASVYSQRIKGNKADNLEESIRRNLLVLDVITKEDEPIDWARTQCNIANAYGDQKKGNRADNLEKSIKFYILALEVQAKNESLMDWAKTQSNLSVTYSERIKGDRADNLEKSIICCLCALEVQTKADSPIDWALTQSNLGNAYSQRMRGKRIDNLKKIIDCHTSALEVFSPQNLPIDCLRTAQNLGNFHFFIKNWQEAIDPYILAITAVELSRSWANSEQSKQEIIEKAIQVYFNLVQCCINTQQYDKALEYAERSKSRNLVELLATRDLYPKGDIPTDILSQLDTLRRQVLSEERRISQRSDFGNSIDPGSRGITNQNTTGIDPDRERLFTLKQDLDNLIIDRVQPIDPSFQLTQQVQSIDFATMQSALPNAETALLTWYISNSRIHAFLVTPFHRQPHVINSTPEQYEALDSLRATYLDTYRTDKKNWRETLPNLLQQISEILNLPEIITKLLQLNSDCNQIILIPHRILHLLPLHALPLNEAGDCLLDLFPGGVSYAPSIQLLKLSQKWHRPALQSLFAIQNPTNDLKYTDVEVPAICDRFQPHVEIVRGNTPDSFRSPTTE